MTGSITVGVIKVILGSNIIISRVKAALEYIKFVDTYNKLTVMLIEYYPSFNGFKVKMFKF